MNQSVYIINCPPFWTKTPPLGLVFLKNFLDQAKIPCKINDLNISAFKIRGASLTQWLSLNQEFEQNLFSWFKQNHPQLIQTIIADCANHSHIGFSLFKRNLSFSLSLAQEILTKYPDKKIIFGGPQVWALDQQDQLDQKNFWVVGEGETATKEIILGSNQKIHRFKELKDLDCLPFLDFDCVDRKNYASVISLLSSRGCIYSCDFCSEKFLSQEFRHHSAKYMAEQIQYLQNKYSCQQFVFCDSMINYDHKWLTEFCRMIIAKNLNIQWEAQLRIKPNFSLDLAKLLKASGCFNLFIGLESGCDRILKMINKGFNPQLAIEVFKTLTEASLHFEISLITGFKDETEDDFNQTLNFIKENKKIIPKIAQINPFVDYLNQFPDQQFPTAQGLQQVKTMIKVIEALSIPYTKSFINNLIY